EVNDHDITDNIGAAFSTLIKNLEKGDLLALFHNEIRIPIFILIETNILVESGSGVNLYLTNAKGIHGMAIDEFDGDIKSDSKVSFTPRSLENMKFIVVLFPMVKVMMI